MISLDSSLIPAIIIFLVLVVALNKLLFQPLLSVQAERESRTTGQIGHARGQRDHYLELFNQYQAAIKNCRIEGYQRQEEVRAEALQKRAEVLAKAKMSAERMLEESRASIRVQAEEAKADLDRAAREIADRIAASILRRTA